MNPTYKIKIVTYDGLKIRHGSYRSFDDRAFLIAGEAVAEANRLRQLTGKCYGVFGPEGMFHYTSAYYRDLPEGP